MYAEETIKSEAGSDQNHENFAVLNRLVPPSPSPLTLAACLGSAFLLNIALRVGHPSLALFLGVTIFLAALAQLLFHAPNRLPDTESASSRTRLETLLILGVCVATASNLFLRSSPLVIFLVFLSLSGVLGAVVYRLFEHSLYRWPMLGIKAVGDVFLANVWLARMLPTFTFRRPQNGLANIRGLVVGAGVVLPVLILLASGDAVFASLFNPLSFGSISIGGSLLKHVVLTGFLSWLLLGISLSASRTRSAVPVFKTISRSTTTNDYQIVVGLLAGVLGVWCLTQLTVAFGGADSFLEANDISKADYARQGFFQLVAVASIVLVTIAKVGSLIRHRAQQAGLLTKSLVLLLSAETLALVAVAYSRLFLYIEAFALTITRLFVAWFLAWLAVMLLAAVLRFFSTQMVGERTAVPFSVASALVFVCCFGWFNPEAFIAETNVTKELSASRQTDGAYLVGLSDDAAVVVAQHFETLETYEQERFCQQNFDEPTSFGFLGWNQSRSDALNAKNSVCEASSSSLGL